MLKKILLLILPITIFVFLYFMYGSQKEITNYPSSGKNIVAFGDSLVSGVGSTEDGGFVRMLSEDLGLPIINLGVSGDTTKHALKRVAQISQYDPKVVILLLGGNDFLQKVSEEETFGNLDQIIEAIHQTGAVVLLVGLEGHILSNSHRKYFDDLTDSRGAAYVPDILDGIFGQPKLMSDSLHPNDKGYRIMANKIKPVLEKLLQDK